MSDQDVKQAFSHYAKLSLVNKTRSLYSQEQHQVPQMSLNEETVEYPIEERPPIVKLLTAEQAVHLEEYFVNERLIMSVARLTDLQKKLLYYKYVEQLSDKAIGQIFHVSSQAISKQHRKVLSKIGAKFYD
ncbi:MULTISPECIES: sigma-70 family RNA polymerase sigma factor [Lactobacillaceae]|jgi:DNA-directed RNA polymerase specialized sigma subunit|uniref:RNA polymerase subunit sigma-70 n=2 Tax=Loigolactobacillus coryniformis TaxID=1610 RepID=A0A2D1KLR3_9LACO|nr:MULTISPECIES: sigma-70 family RNA polymerase sigma factor [Lactobacillaceae]ATO43031.1 RNA polymerase subunit sigma-70 [Loigolactobacillus coryniformis subsp. torquens DSM 20004 = KCTC 3535]ATO54780.1 RNA polymerase subunit sigma-70 [Loigolactobacillus coryniformis subsp. coryniformis KCTC 3167 = DSM 20001]MCL5459474.1 sigma-70 family RNA polymerase sigma factor [Loigolactobacillus coryniformis]OEH89815.1 RNA polymerase subunit sigma-70 [Loigolactobacillus coryniformis subsp. coryniformis]